MSLFKRAFIARALCLLLLLPALARADIFEKGDEISVQANVYNVHYDYDPNHRAFSPLIGMEWRRDNGWLVGGALFMNSFNQFTQLVYAGYIWNLADTGIYGKLYGGLLHGYTGEYAHKVPFNVGGFSPGIIPALGYKLGPVNVETQFFWTNGLMVTAGFRFR